ncbi:MAG: helix-turn-helix domain-containing protein [Gemmatimonadetes bacterium]|nr:helix-turn-helix transcriptional regulator [Gemmatimonadota bacterium]NIQ54518.1 helix-turn-helix transcriptional regulator [Gemmatimonadota bacterium]NIU74720.1 helix-turn-helix domain-containing protein [Gammaproteobacteria bacterium]NIX44644.1 helix-turn-helix domain-containing protein [Gemmatimonadota bacterium]NIY08874.1 helix-turn-helix domain-containing protein [Gemmatimonadota bacterium]
MTVVLAGEIRETTRIGEEAGAALSVVVKPAGVRHADEVGPRGARTLQVVLDPASADSLDDTGTLHRWRWLHGLPAAAPLLILARLLRQGGKAGELEEAILEAVAGLDGEARAGGAVPDWLARVREALDDELESGIGVRGLAALVGAHPVSVSRAFRKHYGLTISAYRRRERVRRAAARIAGSPESLSRIAHGGGYADHPHLCRDFRRTTGLTPSEFRRLAR